jgi:parvulin-like peptidyl-prolyl isomerase
MELLLVLGALFILFMLFAYSFIISNIKVGALEDQVVALDLVLAQLRARATRASLAARRQNLAVHRQPGRQVRPADPDHRHRFR